MRIVAKRPFISSKLGNVPVGAIRDVDDGYAKHLIENGLAVEVTAGPSLSLRDDGKPSFQSPVEANLPGSSSPAGQALQKETVSLSEPGEKKVTYRKKGKSRS
jgi:hypothetical protein